MLCVGGQQIPTLPWVSQPLPPVLFLIFLWSVVFLALAASCVGNECCTVGSSSSDWSCLTFSGVWPVPAELGQDLVRGMLLWPQLQHWCTALAAVPAHRGMLDAMELPWGWAGLFSLLLFSLSDTEPTSVTSLFPLEPAGSLQVAVMWLQPGLYPTPIQHGRDVGS